MKIQALIKAIFIQITLIKITSCLIQSIPIRKDLKTQTCVKNINNLEVDKAEGFVISELMVKGSVTSYAALSYGGWMKIQSTQSQLQNLIGLCTDISIQDISNNSIIGMWLNSAGNTIDFVSSVNTQTQSIDLSTMSYLNQWFSFMILLSKASNKATIKISFKDGVYLTKQITVNTNNLFVTYPYAWLNIDISYQNVNYYNSCSQQKEIYFHYSMDEDYTIDKAIYKQFYVKKDPFLLLELKEWESGRLQSFSPRQKLRQNDLIFFYVIILSITDNVGIILKFTIINLLDNGLK